MFRCLHTFSSRVSHGTHLPDVSWFFEIFEISKLYNQKTTRKVGENNRMHRYGKEFFKKSSPFDYNNTRRYIQNYNLYIKYGFVTNFEHFDGRRVRRL